MTQDSDYHVKLNKDLHASIYNRMLRFQSVSDLVVSVGRVSRIVFVGAPLSQLERCCM